MEDNFFVAENCGIDCGNAFAENCGIDSGNAFDRLLPLEDRRGGTYDSNVEKIPAADAHSRTNSDDFVRSSFDFGREYTEGESVPIHKKIVCINSPNHYLKKKKSIPLNTIPYSEKIDAAEATKNAILGDHHGADDLKNNKKSEDTFLQEDPVLLPKSKKNKETASMRSPREEMLRKSSIRT